MNVAPFNDKKVGTLTITLEAVLNIPSSDFKSGITLSPNPTSDSISIHNKTTEPIDNLKFYDVIGKLVKSVNVNSTHTKTHLNLEDLNSGIYLVKVRSIYGKTTLKKLVIK